jgi:hypothetical protein
MQQPVARTKGVICLGPSGNVQGGFKFMSLKSMKKIIRRNWDAIPMPDTVIDRVNLLGKDQQEQLVFTDCKGCPIGDIELPGVDGDEASHITPDDANNDANDIEIDLNDHSNKPEEATP